MTTHFEQFVQSGLYLRGWSVRTPPIYRRAFKSFDGQGRDLSKSALEAWIIKLRQKGLSPACCNIYIRAMNAFCSWMKEEGHLREPIVLKQVKHHSKPITVFSDQEIATLLAHKPKRFSYLRTWMMIVLMLDTGCRIDEVLSLKKGTIDFDNLLLVVNGKGEKLRRIAFIYLGSVHTAQMHGRFLGGSMLRSMRHFIKLATLLKDPQVSEYQEELKQGEEEFHGTSSRFVVDHR